MGWLKTKKQKARELIDALIKRAEAGDANAQYALGSMYANGKGVPQDDAEAMKWWRLAAEAGDVDAQLFLGIISNVLLCANFIVANAVCLF